MGSGMRSGKNMLGEEKSCAIVPERDKSGQWGFGVLYICGVNYLVIHM